LGGLRGILQCRAPRRAGRILEHRTLLFFALLLTLALASFAAIRQFLPPPAAN
jgi:hypothetical protein